MGQQHKVGKHRTTVVNDDAKLAVTYHETEVVYWDKTTNFITLNTGGWWTPTTKTRMNQAANEFNLGFYIYQEDFQWYVVLECEHGRTMFTNSKFMFRKCEKEEADG
jgi:hypothetical protein